MALPRIRARAYPPGTPYLDLIVTKPLLSTPPHHPSYCIVDACLFVKITFTTIMKMDVSSRVGSTIMYSLIGWLVGNSS